MEKCKYKIGFGNCFATDSEGRNGGVALLWGSDLRLEIKSFSKNHVHVAITQEDNCTWFFMGIYGFLETQNKCKTWQLLRSIKVDPNLP